MSDNELNEKHENPHELTDGEDHWEWWVRFAVLLFGAMILAWIVIFLRLGEISVYAHGVVVPGLGFLTVPLMFWGLLRTVFRPPAIRKSRTLGIFMLVGVGVVGNVPFFAPPLSTEDWTSSHAYRLPFDGEGYVLAGGEDRDRNYHATTATYRWGYDFSFVDADGKRFKLDGRNNQDYVCWGKPVLAPVAGKVIEAEAAVEDNSPGDVDPKATVGNYIVLKAGEGEYVYLAHLKKDSVTVKPGDEVAAGDVVAQCGNSGRSVEPHIHLHAQTTTNFPFSESLPLRFACIMRGESEVRDVMPDGATSWEGTDGDRITNCAK